jgi:hypothetical protein
MPPHKHIINKAMENQQYCTAAFLDVSQVFNKVCGTQGYCSKLKEFYPQAT